MDPAHARFERHYAHFCHLAAAMMLAFAIADLTTADWLGAGSHLGLGVAWLFFPVVRASAHEQGYWRGRRSVFASMQEAGRRGLDFADWIAGEVERQTGPPRRRGRPDGQH